MSGHRTSDHVHIGIAGGCSRSQIGDTAIFSLDQSLPTSPHIGPFGRHADGVEKGLSSVLVWRRKHTFLANQSRSMSHRAKKPAVNQLNHLNHCSVLTWLRPGLHHCWSETNPEKCMYSYCSALKRKIYFSRFSRERFLLALIAIWKFK